MARDKWQGLDEFERPMIIGLLLIGGLMTVTYAVNAWKIQMVTEGRAVCAAALEGTQGLLFVLAMTRIIDLTSSTSGVLAYVAGAFIGTAAAVVVQVRKREPETCPCVPIVEATHSDQPAPQDISLRP